MNGSLHVVFRDVELVLVFVLAVDLLFSGDLLDG
jgi:hypothetical protein